MKIAITGGTGFVGKELTNLLLSEGHHVYILTRSDKKSDSSITYVSWLNKGAKPEDQLQGIDAIINLAGTSINEGRWTAEQKKKIYQSRMDATNEVLRIIEALPQKPSVLVNASAVGIYPTSKHKTYTEDSPERADNFLAKTVEDWEATAKQAEQFDVRVAYGRFGVILGKEEGALPLMALPYKLFVGGKVGTGKQWLSWVHVKDVVRALYFAITTEKLQGPFNVTAPRPLRNDEFGRTLGEVLHRPHAIPAPSFALKAVLGEKSQLVLEGQQVLPQVLLQHGFHFEFPTAKEALNHLYG
ncbi:TIGR01777 family oxidoreductase [Chryseomicrobium palamuruense]|uniref:TIGR01777 family oxidoreductase n=1 Tax=Chryseomicrobium palamuruense TaxID=682973 RepID=A0ABV8UWH1_9BACL